MQVLFYGCVKRLKPTRALVRFYQWGGETHYSVLGVQPNASPREIKIAYLALSKKLHPDLNQGKDDKTAFEIHQSYVRVNQAYAVLGNKTDRAVYDIQLQGRSPTEEEESGRVRSRGERMHTTPTRAEFMSFEERARSMGYNQVGQELAHVFHLSPFFFQDPDYYKKHGNYHRKVVAACIAWIICGCIVQYLVIFKLYDRHTDTLNSNFTVDAATKKNSMLLSAARDRAKERGSVEEQRAVFSRKWAEENPVGLHSKEVED